MKLKASVLVLAIAAMPAASFAAGENNVGCGLGSSIFNGQSGVVPQILAATTNGTSGNQTFGITSGTLGCTQDGTVRSSVKLSMFIDGNMERLARDMSRGNGETMDSLAQLINVKQEDKARFFQVAKANFGQIYASDKATVQDVMTGLRAALSSDATLAGYSSAVI